MPQSHRSYVICEHPHHHARRASWSSETGAMYCGICMREVVKDELGSVCPRCGSQVRQLFDVIDGGTPRSYQSRKRDVARNCSTAEILARGESL